jgi:hypothetical protein
VIGTTAVYDAGSPSIASIEKPLFPSFPFHFFRQHLDDSCLFN